MPEGNLALAQAVVYLSVAPKSNALYTAYGEVQQDVEQTAAEPVPAASAQRADGADEGPRLRARVSVRARSRSQSRRHAMPARQSAGPRLLPSHAGRHRKAHPRADGGDQAPAFTGPRRSPRASKRKNLSAPDATSYSTSARVSKPPSIARTGAMAATPNAPFNEVVAGRALPADVVEDLQRVQKAAQRITSILDLDQLISSVVQEVTQSFGCLETSIYLHDEERGEMVLSGVRGCTLHRKGHRLKIGCEGMVGFVAANGQMRYAPDVRQRSVLHLL